MIIREKNKLICRFDTYPKFKTALDTVKPFYLTFDIREITHRHFDLLGIYELTIVCALQQDANTILGELSRALK